MVAEGPQWVWESIISVSIRVKLSASRKGSFAHIVPLDPAYKAGLAGHVPVKIDPLWYILTKFG